MRFEIVLSLNGYKQALQIIRETFKNLNVWKVRFQDGTEAILYKCGNLWMQRNEDDLENYVIDAIGDRIDHIDLNMAF